MRLPVSLALLLGLAVALMDSAAVEPLETGRRNETDQFGRQILEPSGKESDEGSEDVVGGPDAEEGQELEVMEDEEGPMPDDSYPDYEDGGLFGPLHRRRGGPGEEAEPLLVSILIFLLMLCVMFLCCLCFFCRKLQALLCDCCDDPTIDPKHHFDFPIRLGHFKPKSERKYEETSTSWATGPPPSRLSNASSDVGDYGNKQRVGDIAVVTDEESSPDWWGRRRHMTPLPAIDEHNAHIAPVLPIPSPY